GNNRHRRFVKGTSFNSGNTTSATTGAACSGGGGGGTNGTVTTGPHCGTVLLPGLGHEAGSGKAGDSRCGAVIFNARAKESLLVAEWVFEPESEAVGMRGAAFEGPLELALQMGWTELVCSPLVLDLLWAKLTAGVE
ncbi:unnamed protein product, partial [Ectocarpus sp. 12 AP-2014]